MSDIKIASVKSFGSNLGARAISLNFIPIDTINLAGQAHSNPGPDKSESSSIPRIVTGARILLGGASAATFAAAREVPRVFKTNTLQRKFNLGMVSRLSTSARIFDLEGPIGRIHDYDVVTGNQILQAFKHPGEIATQVRDLHSARVVHSLANATFGGQSKYQIGFTSNIYTTAFTAKDDYRAVDGTLPRESVVIVRSRFAPIVDKVSARNKDVEFKPLIPVSLGATREYTFKVTHSPIRNMSLVPPSEEPFYRFFGTARQVPLTIRYKRQWSPSAFRDEGGTYIPEEGAKFATVRIKEGAELDLPDPIVGNHKGPIQLLVEIEDQQKVITHHGGSDFVREVEMRLGGKILSNDKIDLPAVSPDIPEALQLHRKARAVKFIGTWGKWLGAAGLAIGLGTALGQDTVEMARNPRKKGRHIYLPGVGKTGVGEHTFRYVVGNLAFGAAAAFPAAIAGRSLFGNYVWRFPWIRTINSGTVGAVLGGGAGGLGGAVLGEGVAKVVWDKVIEPRAA